MKILIVDDDEVLAKTIKAMIASEAHRIKTASDGDEAYFTYLQFRPDIIITDIQMPEKSGFELVREIRIHDPAIKTIYMSGNGDPFFELIEREKKHHQARFLGKPFSRSQLMELISESLS